MEIKKLNVSVVVLARDHNPSIMHPSFLSSQGIVPEEWELAEPPICTPPLSVVKYKDGIIFTVESNKFQVLQSPPPQQLSDSHVPQLALRYIEKLPHVRYTAVGINMAVALIHPKPEEFLIERFLVLKSCDVDDLHLKAVSLRFVYPVENGVLNLSCEPGVLEDKKPASKSSSVIISANYHTECAGDSTVEEVKKAIETFPERCNHFDHAVITKIFRVETTKQ